MEDKIKRNFSLLIQDKITVGGVESIITIAERVAEIKLCDKRLYLTGNGFTPLHLDLDKGILVLSGEVSTVKIGQNGAIAIKRIFK